MSERLRQAIEAIIRFIRDLRRSGGPDRPEPFMIDRFKKDVAEEEKRNRGFAKDFCAFYEKMDEEHPRGSNIYGTGVDKYDMPKGNKNAAYRVLAYHDRENGDLIFLAIYPKDDEKRVLTKEAIKNLKELVTELKSGSVDLTSLAEAPL